ncbi:MAG TPA: hypothetical protein VF010_13535 [Methylomirabilota bacterium]|nr:hypothetical protein [Methylomirabilota bacterium]
MRTRVLVCLLAGTVALSGCSAVKKVLGVADPGEPSIVIKSAEPRWLLIKNPRYGDVPSEPEYVWVEEDKVPTTMTTLLRGQRAIIALPEIVAKYGTPPGGGKISPRQGTMFETNDVRPASSGSAAASSRPTATATAAAAPVAVPGPKPEVPKRGFVVYVDTTRIVIDLTSVDGIQPGTVVSLRRDRIPLVHPVTGELLGELDEEIATARVIEIRDRFSVAEVQNVAPGSEIQVRDRVIPK